jgi:GNAT superfamily N-acetyltransferase
LTIPDPAGQDTKISFRDARRDDLPAIIGLLADDPMGSKRESVADNPAPEYIAAFDAINSDPNNRLVIATQGEGIVGCLQLTFIPGLSRSGATRGQIESVRIASNLRGRGLGYRFFEWAIEECRKFGCDMVQLTTDKSRQDAHRFYHRLGFQTTHDGMKLIFEKDINQ